MDTQHVGTTKMLNSEKIGANKIDKSVFHSFNQITDANETIRLKNSLQLLQTLAKNDDQNQNGYQHKYALKRLVRGVGSSTTASRTGFFTTLVGFLKVVENIDFSEIFEVIQKELQIGGSSEQDKIDTHANTGRILVCGALIQSGKIMTANDEDFQIVIDMLLKSAKVKKFHRSLSYVFLCDLMKSLTVAKFKCMMPLLETELGKPWPKQTLESLYFLLVAEDTHPTVITKFCARHFNVAQVFCAASYAQFAEILLHDKNVLNVNHPIYDYFSSKISNSKELVKFWATHVDPRLKEPSKLKEVCTVKMLTGIFQHSTQKAAILSKLLTPNVVTQLVDTFQHKKLKTNFVIDFYRELFVALVDYVKRLRAASGDGEVGGGLNIIQRLIGTHLMFDRLTASDFVANMISLLVTAEVKTMVEQMKRIVLGEALNSEKLFALQLIVKLSSHPTVVGDLEWRTQQILFGLNLANFKTKDGYSLIKETSEDVAESIPQLNLKQQFHHSLQTRFKSLEDERKVLQHLIEHVAEIVRGKHAIKYMKSSLSSEGHRVFNEMYAEVTEKTTGSGAKNKLDLVFSVLLLHMGLQLFNDEKLAISAIDELKMCMKRVVKTKTKRKSLPANIAGVDPEPEWIEVVVDLFLHLLSQNSSLLRNIINKVFPQLCPFLTIEAVHQILSLLDMNIENPLSTDAEVEAEDDEDENDPSDDEDDESSDDDEEPDKHAGDEEEDDDDDDEEDSMMGEEGNVSDQLRSAVRQALGGAAPESDLESLDLDDMNDGDARRLDEALTAAFKMYSENRKRNKKSKKEKAVETTVIHFRLRVLDLLDIYVKTEPKMSFVVEIMVTMYDLLSYCVKDGGPLLSKVEHLLNKITAIKHFTDTCEVSDKNLEEILRNLSEKKFTSFAVAQRNLYLAKCVIFIINCSKMVKPSSTSGKTQQASSAVTVLLSQYLNEFMVSRNPVLPLNIFTTIFGLVWPGIWDLSRILVVKGVKAEVVQSIRRTQIIVLISKLFRNHQFLLVEPKNTQAQLNYIETEIFASIRDQAKKLTVNQKVFGELLDLLIEINKCHTRIPSIASKIDWTETNRHIQLIRNQIVLESTLKTYRKYCQVMKLEFIRNKEENKTVKVNGKGNHAAVLSNGHTENGDDDDMSVNGEITDKDEEDSGDDDDDETETNTKKRKMSSEQSLKLKKQKNDARAKFSSKGIDGGLSFASLAVTEKVVGNGVVTPKISLGKKNKTSPAIVNKKFKKSKMKAA